MPKSDDSRVAENTKTRLEIVKDDGRAPHYPSVEFGEYLINYLFEVGPVLSDSMGSARVTNTELRNWQENIGLRLHPWESRFILRLSGDYLSESHKATTHGCPAPYQNELAQADKSLSVISTKNSIRALANL